MVAIDVKRPLALSALVLLATVVVVSGQGVDITTTPIQNQDGLARFRSMFQLDPVVDTGVSELGGRKVYVHVPKMFDLKLDTRPENQGLRVSQTVMSGLVSIYMDRTRDATTNLLTGPVSVKMLGIPMYQNQEARALGGVPVIAPAAIPPPAV